MERASGIQGGQYINLTFNQTWAKKRGRTLKEIQLSLPDNHLLPFLQCAWGLQVSFYTSIARRVPLRELISDIMPEFVESLSPIPPLWESLKTDYKIVDAFQSNNLQDWLRQLTDTLQDLVALIIRYILSMLQHTGIDEKGEHFTIAWIQRGKPFQCFDVPCKKESYWARILADSRDCATFAYITPKCLEIDGFKCCGPTATWQNTSALLETAVYRHKPNEERSTSISTPWILKHSDQYSIGKPDLLLRIKVERPNSGDHPRLHILWSNIPPGIYSRLNRQLERLRERQAVDAKAENVVILTKIVNI